MQELQSTVLADGLTYGEGPRWHDGQLWVSDMHVDAVRTIGADGALATGAEAHHPSGLGWTRDGELLVTSLQDALLRRIGPDGPQVHCDLSAFGVALNDMVALPDGRAYVDVYTQMGGGPPPGVIVLVSPDGEARQVAAELTTPNGLAVTADGTTLIAAETFGSRLHAWTIEPDGTLTGQRVFAEMEGRHPDGICLDVEGGVWVGCFLTNEFVRVLEGGEVTHRVSTGESWAIAPALGGPDLRTLHLVVTDTTFEGIASGPSECRIETVQVPVPGVGSP